MGTVVVDVYYNYNLMAMLKGYSENDSLLFVCQHSSYHGADYMLYLERVFSIMQDIDYGRSMCVGDVLHVQAEGESMWFECSIVGFTAIDRPKNLVQ